MNWQSKEKVLHIQMLDEFVLSSDCCSISDSENRSRKVWSLLAYLVHFRGRVVSSTELIKLLWDEDSFSIKRGNALKAILHRARASLAELKEHFGQELILRQKEGYVWNPDIPCIVDVDQLLEACERGDAALQPEQRRAQYLRAVQLYKGTFLAKLSAEGWVLEAGAQYREEYSRALRELLLMLSQEEEHRLIVSICTKALELDPYDENLYFYLIKALVDMGKQPAAMECYEKMINLFFSEFGRKPSARLQALYRQIAKTSNAMETDLSLIKEQLREGSAHSGAFFCEYEFFKDIYRIQVRSLARSRAETYLGLLTAVDLHGDALPQQRLNFCMERLRKLIHQCLRRGDVFARYSPSQYIIMLPCANYANSCKVMERVIKRFQRENPNSPAILHYSVQPLEPEE